MTAAMALAPTSDQVPGATRPRLVLAVATMAAALDGFDGQAMAFVATALSQDWGVALPAFGAVFSLGIFGLIVGGVLLAPLGDRVGRRQLILWSGLGVGIATVMTAFTTTIPQLMAIRFVTGICLGAMMPGLITVAHEAPEARWRAMYVTILMCGFPMGGFVGGMLSAWLLPIYGWEALFAASGIATLVIVGLLLVTLENRSVPRPVAAPARATLPRGALLRGRYLAVTLTLWLLFFATLLNVYLLASWLPALLERDGFTGSQAAMAAGVLNLGGVAGGLGLGFLVARAGERVLVPAFAVGAAAVLLLGFVGGTFAALLATALVVGAVIPGGQVCNNAIAAARYPARLRATGIGWAQGVGRIGSVIGPALVGLALAAQLSNRQIFATAAILSLVAALAAFILSRLGAVNEETEA